MKKNWELEFIVTNDKNENQSSEKLDKEFPDKIKKLENNVYESLSENTPSKIGKSDLVKIGEPYVETNFCIKTIQENRKF